MSRKRRIIDRELELAHQKASSRAQRTRSFICVVKDGSVYDTASENELNTFYAGALVLAEYGPTGELEG